MPKMPDFCANIRHNLLSFSNQGGFRAFGFRAFIFGLFCLRNAAIESIKHIKQTKNLKNKIKTLKNVTRDSHVIFDGARGTNGDVTFVTTQR